MFRTKDQIQVNNLTTLQDKILTLFIHFKSECLKLGLYNVFIEKFSDSVPSNVSTLLTEKVLTPIDTFIKQRSFKVLTGIGSAIIPSTEVINELGENFKKEPLGLLLIELLNNIAKELKPYISENQAHLTLAMPRSQSILFTSAKTSEETKSSSSPSLNQQ